MEDGQSVRLAKLRTIRLQRFVTQEELARKAGVSVPTLTRLESGKFGARISTVRKLAAALDVRPEELIG